MCCPPEADSGFFYNIRRIFTGKPTRQRCSSPCREKVYAYTMSQLKCIEQDICCLEDEVRCLECAVRDAFCSECNADCEFLKCSLKNISDKLECIRCDLECAHSCYNPCRDRCEFQFICCLLDRVRCLDSLISDLCMQLDCLESQGGCYPELSCNRAVACRTDCRKPCCYPCSYPCESSCDPCRPRNCSPCERRDCSPCEPSYSPCGLRGGRLCGPRGCCPYENQDCSPCRPRACSPCRPRACSPCRPSCTPCGPISCDPCGLGECGPVSCGFTACEPTYCRTSSPCGQPCGQSAPCGLGSTCYPNTRRSQPRRLRCGAGCRNSCCQPVCDSGCTNSCCVQPNVCRTNSVIPLGVMLVKL